MKLIWNKKNDWYATENAEFNICFEENFWILRYTDFWTLYPTSFLVNIKKQGSEMFTVSELQQFAQKQHEIYLETIEKQ
jgi:hypothetical protein